jgi:hypothetical protein
MHQFHVLPKPSIIQKRTFAHDPAKDGSADKAAVSRTNSNVRFRIPA